jgi:hypothetical protein
MSRSIDGGRSVEALEPTIGGVLLSKRTMHMISERKTRTADSLRRHSYNGRSGHEEQPLCHADTLAVAVVGLCGTKNEIHCLSGVRVLSRGHLVILLGLPSGCLIFSPHLHVVVEVDWV